MAHAITSRGLLSARPDRPRNPRPGAPTVGRLLLTAALATFCGGTIAFGALQAAPPPQDAAPQPTPKPAEPMPPKVDVDVAGAAFGQGAELFENGRYDEALAIFRKLQETNPDDARVWYFSALARGFATGDWGDETRRLADKGAQRERAGTPAADRIDAAFSILSPANGKDRLEAFRRRAAN